MRELIVGFTFVAFAVYLFWKDRRVRSGRDRSWLSNYRNTGIPIWFRNAPLVARFSAMTALGWGLGVLAFWATESAIIPRALGAVLVISLVTLGTVAMVFSIVGTYRAPAALKPPWLKDEESQLPEAAAESRLNRLADLGVLAVPIGFLVVAIVAGLVLLLTTLLR